VDVKNLVNHSFVWGLGCS